MGISGPLGYQKRNMGDLVTCISNFQICDSLLGLIFSLLTHALLTFVHVQRYCVVPTG